MMKCIVVANWKMNPPSWREAKKLFEAEKRAAEKARKSNVVIAPPAVFLRELSKRYRGSRVAFAVQNAHWEAGGGGQYGVVRAQLRAALADVAPAKLGGVLVVYEPLWTVGKDTTMDPREMHQMAIFMRKCIVDTHGDAGRSLKILYGGSVDEKNAGAMLREAEVRGFLVGRASIDAKGFSALLKV